MRSRLLRATAAALFVVVGVACDIQTPDLSDVGTVRFLDIEGGCWAIESNDQLYEPLELPEAVRQDGLAVSFEAVRRNDMGSFCMIGPIIELLRIEALSLVRPLGVDH